MTTNFFKILTQACFPATPKVVLDDRACDDKIITMVTREERVPLLIKYCDNSGNPEVIKELEEKYNFQSLARAFIEYDKYPSSLYQCNIPTF